ncbi:hypothetical protein GGI43DRAFT_426742 [Trichoderma evansii]
MTAISQSEVTEVLLSNDDRLPRLQNTLQTDQQNTCPSLPAADDQQTHWLRTIVSTWPYELLNLLLSILAFISIIIFLRVYEGKTLSQWGLPISISAIISILAAVFKGTLALPITEGMDVRPATIWFSRRRGPWGSVLLILHQFTRADRSYLASLGALIVIIALAVDPFSQALVNYYSCLRHATSPAAIPRGDNYTAFGAHIFGLQNSLDGPMQLAVYLGLLEPPVNSSVSVVANCPTGSCTFPSDQGATFSTLSMCRSYLDVTNTVVSHPGTWNFTVPGGPSLTPSILLNTSTAIEEQDYWWERSTLLSFEALTVRYTDPACGNDNCLIEPLALSCSLTPCLKTYATNFTNSVYLERELNSEPLRWGPWTRDFSLALNRTFDSGTWKDCNPTRQQAQTNIVEVFVPNGTATGGSQSKVQYNDTTGAEPSTMWYPQECVYIMDSVATGATSGANTGPTWLQTPWNNGTAGLSSATTFVEGLATSIGGQIRKNSADSATGKFVLGQAWEIQTCIAVHWSFLTFFSILLALELAFFVAVMVVNQLNHWNVDWKSSTLALLFPGLSDASDANNKEMPLSNTVMMLNAAKQIKARLEESDGNWRLFKDI